jgi:hypothetical protein
LRSWQRAYRNCRMRPAPAWARCHSSDWYSSAYRLRWAAGSSLAAVVSKLAAEGTTRLVLGCLLSLARARARSSAGSRPLTRLRARSSA